MIKLLKKIYKKIVNNNIRNNQIKKIDYIIDS